jgi:hypothetical protein
MPDVDVKCNLKITTHDKSAEVPFLNALNPIIYNDTYKRDILKEIVYFLLSI